jgi:hypothetical protein
LSEVAPRNLRGAAVTLHQLALSFGMLVASLLGSEKIFGTSQLWPLLYGVTLVPALSFFCISLFCCESPKFVYFKKNDHFETENSINLNKKRSFEIRFPL